GDARECASELELECCERRDRLSREALDDEWQRVCSNCVAKRGRLYGRRPREWYDGRLRRFGVERCGRKRKLGAGERDTDGTSNYAGCDHYGRPYKNQVDFAIHLLHPLCLEQSRCLASADAALGRRKSLDGVQLGNERVERGQRLYL